MKIKFWINTWINSINFWWMKKKADKLHRLTGKQYHIVPVSDTKLGIVNNDVIKGINKGLPKSQRIDYTKLQKSVYYSTPLGTTLRK